LPMHYVYILENPKGRFYIGHTSDLQRRLSEHNSPEGHSHLGKYTHKNDPWRLVYQEEFPDRSAAMHREHEIKRWKSSTMIRRKLLRR